MPDYNGAGFTWGHLWFILNLFVISLISLPVFLGLKTKAGQRITAGLASFPGRDPAILLLALPFPFVRYFLTEVDGKPFFMYLLVFVFVLMSDARNQKALERNRWVALILGIACMLVNYAVMLSGVRLEEVTFVRSVRQAHKCNQIPVRDEIKSAGECLSGNKTPRSE